MFAEHDSRQPVYDLYHDSPVLDINVIAPGKRNADALSGDVTCHAD